VRAFRPEVQAPSRTPSRSSSRSSATPSGTPRFLRHSILCSAKRSSELPMNFEQSAGGGLSPSPHPDAGKTTSPRSFLYARHPLSRAR
jgi:hypothetical protein